MPAWQLDSTILPVINFAATLLLVDGKPKEAARIAAGDTSTAFALLREMGGLPRRNVFTKTQYALTYLAMGDTTHAFQWLEKSAAVMPAALAVGYPLTYPPYEKVRGTAHFNALLRKAGVDPVTLANVTNAVP